MLRIYGDILDFLGELAPLVTRIARHDRDLGRQLRRASNAVALNCAEGMYARDGSRRQAYGVALREMRESYAAIEIGMRLGYIPRLAPAFEDKIQKIIGTLVRLAMPRRR